MITLFHRPYVFAFLIAFLCIAGRHLGWRRTLVWLVSGFGIALVSEASSIRNGFPYGMYHYIYENLRGEWMLFGVPVWDSLSYPFMIYAGYAMAGFVFRISYFVYRRNFLVALFGALFTMLLDIIIDPLTVLGDRWFLGRVYYYPHGGPYFGVPLTNFAGWFLVPFVVIALNQAIWKFTNHESRTTNHDLLGALFYLSIALFNIAITFWIGAWPLLMTSLTWFALVIAITSSDILSHRT